MPLTRRQFLGLASSAGALAVGTGFYSAMIEPFWLEVRERPIPVSGWPAELDGLRIAHLTDLHFDWKLPKSYAAEISRRIREEIKPDLVAFTGDLTTHNTELLPAAAEWLDSFGAPTFACLGNHDYDPDTSARAGAPTVLADQLQMLLRGTRVSLLRNASAPFEFNSTCLHIAGVEDYYTGLLDARLALRNVPPGEPKLMLCHNPDAADLVDPHMASDTAEGEGPGAGGGLILSGHTHGGQIRLPFVGQLLFNTMNTARTEGLYPLAKGQLYISRGVGYLIHARLLCRPEIAVHLIKTK